MNKRYQVYAKRLDGSVEKWDAPKTLESAVNCIKAMTWMENTNSNKHRQYMYWYCLPLTKEEYLKYLEEREERV